MEVVASIASIAQLTQYALSVIAKISELYNNIKDGPAQQRQQLGQLERLFSTIQTLNENSALNTSSIREHLAAITARIEELRDVLEGLVAEQVGGRITKYCKAFIKACTKDKKEEKHILAVFIDLEKDKSALLLSITETHTDLSARIYNEITERLPCMQAAQLEMLSLRQRVQAKKASANSKAASNKVASSSSEDSRIVEVPINRDRILGRLYPGSNGTQPDEEQDMDSDAEPRPPLLNKHSAEGSVLFKNMPSHSQNMTGHLFESIIFREEGDVVAGDVYGDVGASKREDKGLQKHRYIKVEIGKGTAVMGNVYQDGFWDKFFGTRT